jgi:hypothetical protein
MLSLSDKSNRSQYLFKISLILGKDVLKLKVKGIIELVLLRAGLKAPLRFMFRILENAFSIKD